MALIDRQTLIDSFCSQCTVDKPETCSTIRYGDKWCNEVYTILNAPTVDAVPVVHGWWKTVEDWDGDEHYQCSVCGAEFVLIDGDPDDNDYLFCPHCGAVMDGKDGDNHDSN